MVQVPFSDNMMSTVLPSLDLLDDESAIEWLVCSVQRKSHTEHLPFPFAVTDVDAVVSALRSKLSMEEIQDAVKALANRPDILFTLAQKDKRLGVRDAVIGQVNVQGMSLEEFEKFYQFACSVSETRTLNRGDARLDLLHRGIEELGYIPESFQKFPQEYLPYLYKYHQKQGNDVSVVFEKLKELGVNIEKTWFNCDFGRILTFDDYLKSIQAGIEGLSTEEAIEAVNHYLDTVRTNKDVTRSWKTVVALKEFLDEHLPEYPVEKWRHYMRYRVAPEMVDIPSTVEDWCKFPYLDMFSNLRKRTYSTRYGYDMKRQSNHKYRFKCSAEDLVRLVDAHMAAGCTRKSAVAAVAWAGIYDVDLLFRMVDEIGVRPFLAALDSECPVEVEDYAIAALSLSPAQRDERLGKLRNMLKEATPGYLGVNGHTKDYVKLLSIESSHPDFNVIRGVLLRGLLDAAIFKWIAQNPRTDLVDLAVECMPTRSLREKHYYDRKKLEEFNELWETLDADSRQFLLTLPPDATYQGYPVIHFSAPALKEGMVMGKDASVFYDRHGNVRESVAYGLANGILENFFTTDEVIDSPLMRGLTSFGDALPVALAEVPREKLDERGLLDKGSPQAFALLNELSGGSFAAVQKYCKQAADSDSSTSASVSKMIDCSVD